MGSLMIITYRRAGGLFALFAVAAVALAATVLTVAVAATLLMAAVATAGVVLLVRAVTPRARLNRTARPAPWPHETIDAKRERPRMDGETR